MERASTRYYETRLSISKKYRTCDAPAVYATGLTATVLLAEETETTRKVAIKVIDKGKLEKDPIVRPDGRVGLSELVMARLEVTIHQNLPAHDNIVPLLDAEETPNSVILVTPYTNSGDLWDKIRYGETVLEYEARNCVGQILNALELLHCELNHVHADIKPHNLLLFKVGGKFVVQLCDFGLTEKLIKGQSIPFTGLRGTSGYFAPEMIGEQDYSYGVDIFALGVILFVMIGGYEPFYPPTKFEDGAQFDSNYWSHISQECKDLIFRMLELNPNTRITARDALAHPWFKLGMSNSAEVSNGFGAPPNAELRFWDPGQLPKGPYYESPPVNPPG